jgi:hypothetical protein
LGETVSHGHARFLQSGARSLFLKALQSYLDRLYSLTRQVLDNPDPERAIADWFQLLLGAATDPSTNKGCFAINSPIALSPNLHQLDSEFLVLSLR